MIFRVYGAFRASYFLTKAFHFASQEDDDKALYFLDKSKEAFAKETYSDLLLRGFLYCEKGRWEDAIYTSGVAIKKIEESKRLNADEKKYLCAYAADTINLSIVRGELNEKMVPIGLDFNVENVSERIRRRFGVIVQGRPGSSK